LIVGYDNISGISGYQPHSSAAGREMGAKRASIATVVRATITGKYSAIGKEKSICKIIDVTNLDQKHAQEFFF